MPSDRDPLPRPTRIGPPAPGVLRLVALGGLGEIGMNCLALEQEDGLVVIDCGVTFPTTDLGIDVYHPRFDHLEGREDRLLGVVITHGHEDHIGALPYLLADHDVPVYAPPHALELIRHRLAEHGFDAGEVELLPVSPGRSFKVGERFDFEPIRVTHSIADATALAIETDAGTVVHTGDFKLDASPIDGELTDEARLGALGDAGVRLLLSDSTNVDSPGTSASESEVGAALHEIVTAAKGRVVIGVFASNVQRLRALGDIAMATGRRLCLLGRSVNNHVKVAHAVGRLRWPSDLVVPPEVAASMPRERVLIVAGGTQAERQAALPRLANGTHQTLRLTEGDTVILSSRIIPGNDRPVFDMMADFLRLGAHLVTRITDRRIHASGHAHQAEQLRMIELTRPRAFLPVHGTLHHLVRHAALARDAGVGELLVVENGEVVELTADAAPAKKGKVVTGKVATANGDELAEEVIRERAQLGRSGVAFVSVVLDRQGASAARPHVVARGAIDPQSQGVARKVELAVAQALDLCDARTRGSDEAVGEAVRQAARRALESHTGGRPVVVVTVTRP